MVKKFTLVMFFLGFLASVSLYGEPLKIVTLSDTDVISMRRDLAIAKKIVQFLWSKDITNKFLLSTPLMILLFEKKISVEQLITHYPSIAPYKDKLYKLITLEESIRGTFDLLQELKKQGVMLVLASDCASDVLEYKKAKNPEVFNLFDAYYHETQTTGKKSDIKFYAGLRQTINELASVTHATEILFVDSNKTNIDAAQKSDQHITPHLFLSSVEFKEELIKRGYIS